MKVHILDDWFDTLRGLSCFAKLSTHDVTVWTDHQPDPARLAERVADADALVLFRERTKIGASLLDRVPKLKLISHPPDQGKLGRLLAQRQTFTVLRDFMGPATQVH